MPTKFELPMSDLLLTPFAGMLTIAALCTLPVLPILLGASIGRRTGARQAAQFLSHIQAPAKPHFCGKGAERNVTEGGGRWRQWCGAVRSTKSRP
jgi:hypothetical protein